MKELTLEHLAKRLPYGLKILRPDGRTILKVAGLVNNLYIFREHGEEVFGSIITKTNKPILRPLSDLTKEIEHNGETFVPIERIKFLNKAKMKYFGRYDFENIGNPEIIIPESLPNWMYNKLIEWHFVLDEPEGTWIDVNTLDENPYK